MIEHLYNEASPQDLSATMNKTADAVNDLISKSTETKIVRHLFPGTALSESPGTTKAESTVFYPISFSGYTEAKVGAIVKGWVTLYPYVNSAAYDKGLLQNREITTGLIEGDWFTIPDGECSVTLYTRSTSSLWNFDDGLLTGWSTVSSGITCTWTTATGYVSASSNAAVGRSVKLAPSQYQYASINISLDVWPNNNQENLYGGIIYNYVDINNFNYFVIGIGFAKLGRFVAGSATDQVSVANTYTYQSWHTLTLDVSKDGYVTGAVGGVVKCSYDYLVPFAERGVAMGRINTYLPSGTTYFRFDNFTIGGGAGTLYAPYVLTR